MTKANWVKTTPSAGSGDGAVDVSSVAKHTGRKFRSSTLTWKAANVEDVVRTLNQAGKPEHVDIDDAAAADKGGKLVTISGVSNSAKLTFSLGIGSLSIALPATYIANGMTINNGAAINGDPGASAEYNFSIAIQVPENSSVDQLSRQIIVEDEAGNRDVCQLTQASGDAYITIAEGPIELDWQGSPVTVEVKSNTTWAVE